MKLLCDHVKGLRWRMKQRVSGADWVSGRGDAYSTSEWIYIYYHLNLPLFLYQEIPAPRGINDSGCLLGDTDLFDAEEEDEDEEESLEAIRASVKQKAKKHKVHLYLLSSYTHTHTHTPSLSLTQTCIPYLKIPLWLLSRVCVLTVDVCLCVCVL